MLVLTRGQGLQLELQGLCEAAKSVISPTDFMSLSF